MYNLELPTDSSYNYVPSYTQTRVAGAIKEQNHLKLLGNNNNKQRKGDKNAIKPLQKYTIQGLDVSQQRLKE